MMFTYPEEIISHLRKAWRSNGAPRGVVPRLPDSRYVKDFLSVAYHASMLTEEQRQIGFRLAFITPELADQLAGPAEFGRLFEPVIFVEPRDFKVKEILRLAPATDHTKVLICVSPMRMNGNGKKKLRIWGLIDTGSSWWDFTHGEAGSGVPPPNCLTLSSIEPGNLTFSREGAVLFSLKRGSIVTPSRQTLYQGPIAAFLEDGVNSMYEDTKTELGPDEAHKLEVIGDFPRQSYFSFIERLLFQIREERHGGALIVLPDAVTIEEVIVSELVNLKYPCDFDNVWAFMVSSLANRCRYISLYREMYSGQSQIPVDKHHLLTAMKEQQLQLDRRISDTANLIGSTSQVDGAVFITDRFRLLGFGAEIRVTAFDLKTVHLAVDHEVEDTEPVPIESYGTRHRSAFRYCWELPESAAFVVSQDGGVKGVKRVEDKLVFWPDINFGPLGI